MAWYYVKDDGTATGDAGRYASQQTGSFATLGTANYYANIQAAIAATTPPVAGDFINVSDLHAFTTTSTISITGIATNPFFIVAVDDANMDAGRTSGNLASETCTDTANDVNLSNVYASGMSFASSDNIVFSLNNIITDGKLTVTGSIDSLLISGDGVSLSTINTEIALNDAAAFIFVGSGGLFSMIGGSITTTSGGITRLIDGFSAGGGAVRMTAVDTTAVTGTLVADVGASHANDDVIDVRLDMCKIATGVAFTNETFKSYAQRALFTRCSDTSAAAEYQYHLHAFGGDVDDDSSIYRNEDEAFTESAQKISYKIVTNSDASLGSPLWLDFPVLRYSKLATAATDTLRFYLTSASALTDKDFYIEVSYPDGTNKQTPNFISSAPTTVGGTLDLMATGTTLTTDSTSTWTGGLTNKYQIDVSTAGDAGADCQPIVKVYITKPSITIQLASEFGLN